MHFVNPLFLIGLVAVAIPILVHLFNFRRYKKVYFSNVEQLQQLQSETKRQSRLRELLILAARILAVVFLVLAFAQPYIPVNKQVIHRGGSAVSVYIDNSFSMGNTNSDGTLLEMGKRKAREIARAYKPSDRFQLVTNGMTGSQYRWVSRDEFLLLVDEVDLSPSSRMLEDVLTRQYDFMASATSADRELYVVSDFQESGVRWDHMPSDTLVHTTFVPLEANQIGNIYIDSLSMNAPVYRRGSTVQADVWVTNTGTEAVEKVPVRLFLNDNERALASVDLQPGERQAVPLHFTIDATGVVQGRVETADYPITFDDQLFFCLNISDQTEVLCINGATDNTFLHRLFDGDSVVHYRVVAERGVDFNSLTDYHFIILNELPAFTTGLAQALLPFVEKGGTLLVIPAEQAQMDAYNQSLALLHAPQLGRWIKQSAKASQVNTSSTHYSYVFDGRNDQMELPTVQQHYKLQSGGNTLRESLISMANGDDYLTLSSLGNGKVFLFAAPLRQEYTDFVQQALFVPTLYNMALYSRPLGKVYHTLDGLEPIALTARYNTGDGLTKMRALDTTQEMIPDLRVMADRTYLIPHNDILLAGPYGLFNEGRLVEGLAFNYSRNESQMEFFSKGDIASAMKDYQLGNNEVVRNADKPLDNLIRQRNEGTPLWRWCIVLSLLFLLAEILLIRLMKR